MQIHGTRHIERQAPAHRRHALVDQTISKHATAQAAQRDDRLTGAGHRPKVRKILDTTDHRRHGGCAMGSAQGGRSKNGKGKLIGLVEIRKSILSHRA